MIIIPEKILCINSIFLQYITKVLSIKTDNIFATMGIYIHMIHDGVVDLRNCVATDYGGRCYFLLCWILGKMMYCTVVEEM